MVRFSTCTMYSSFLLWSLYHRWNSHRTHKGLNNPIWSGIWGELDCWLSVCMKTMALAFSLQKDEQKLRERPDPPHTQGFSSYPGGQGGTSRPLWNQVVPELLAHCQRGKQTFAVHNHWGLDGGGTALTIAFPGAHRDLCPWRLWSREPSHVACPVGLLCTHCRAEADQACLLHHFQRHGWVLGACSALLSQGKAPRTHDST